MVPITPILILTTMFIRAKHFTVIKSIHAIIDTRVLKMGVFLKILYYTR